MVSFKNSARHLAGTKKWGHFPAFEVHVATRQEMKPEDLDDHERLPKASNFGLGVKRSNFEKNSDEITPETDFKKDVAPGRSHLVF